MSSLGQSDKLIIEEMSFVNMNLWTFVRFVIVPAADGVFRGWDCQTGLL